MCVCVYFLLCVSRPLKPYLGRTLGSQTSCYISPSPIPHVSHAYSSLFLSVVRAILRNEYSILILYGKALLSLPLSLSLLLYLIVCFYTPSPLCFVISKVTPLSLKQLYAFGKDPTPEQRLANARFLHRELPVRLSQRAVELMNLPHGLSAMPGIQQVMFRRSRKCIHLFYESYYRL